ncbi:MAG: hypothetical protein IJT87_10170 [Ruminiclostridium sp.]|nr:hypothetical protein [Ruminiclostridium sp.]
MTEIVIIGDSRDTALEKLIKTTLSKTYRVIYIKEQSLTDTGSGYELIFFDCARPRLDGVANAVIIAKRSAVLSVELPRDCTVILDSDKPTQTAAAVRSGIAAIDCGFSPTSTVSFTGETDDALVISLNRSITALSGREIQPLELPCPKHGADAYTLMSFTAMRLLLDDFDSELGELI